MENSLHYKDLPGDPAQGYDSFIVRITGNICNIMCSRYGDLCNVTAGGIYSYQCVFSVPILLFF